MLRILIDEAFDGLSNVLSWFLRSTKGEYGAKKAEQATALGQPVPGALHNADARKTKRSTMPARKVG